MLNLVQLQERLKDVPMQYLMQYANGSNPQVPPFLALTELNRRKKMQESAAAEQAKEMEGAPTIKEQIEQSAGLLALQGNRQKQAAQQQAGIQAAMPMAAPNTTTSEPAQMAGGGFIDDIVVPRDYQAGGQVNPEMMKRMMMMKAMQRRRPGLAGLPMRQDMFKRGDYAGGGIVAFAGEDGSLVQSPVGQAPWEIETEEERAAREGKGSILRAIRKALALGGDPEFYSRDIDAQKEKQRKEGLPGLTDRQQSMIEDARDRAMTDILNRPTVSRVDAQTPARIPGSAPNVPQGLAGLNMLKKLQGIDLEQMFPVPGAFDEKAQFEKQQARKKMYGISDQYLTDAEQRLLGRVGKQEARRAEQPMDQLTEFLTSVAGGPRGGTFGTQGAAGAKASAKMRAAQMEANERQDEANEQLRFAIAEKRQALARGDMQAAEAAEKDRIAAIENARKAKLDYMKAVGQLETQAAQVEAQRAAALKPSAFMEQLALFRADPKEFEKFKRASGMSDETYALRMQQNVDKLLKEDPKYFEYRLLAISPKPEDQKKAAQIRAQAYAEAGVGLPGASGLSGNQRIRLDEKGNVIP